ncbi:MAG: hypothetical protein QXK89_05270 [Candidatus Bathyarchaeia archaeon]
MVKVSVNRFVHQRVNKARREVEACASRFRRKVFKSLEDIFVTAGMMAKGEIKHQRVNGKMVKVSLAERQIWLRIAEQAAEAMRSLADNVDEKEIQTRLNIIEMLLKEVTKHSEEQSRKR